MTMKGGGAHHGKIPPPPPPPNDESPGAIDRAALHHRTIAAAVAAATAAVAAQSGVAISRRSGTSLRANEEEQRAIAALGLSARSPSGAPANVGELGYDEKELVTQLESIGKAMGISMSEAIGTALKGLGPAGVQSVEFTGSVAEQRGDSVVEISLTRNGAFLLLSPSPSPSPSPSKSFIFICRARGDIICTT